MLSVLLARVDMKMKYRLWEIWCKALGTKAFEDKTRADKVAYIRTCWVLLHITTCLFIIAGNCKLLFF